MRVVVLLSPAKTLNWATSPASLSELWSQPKLLQAADPVVEVMRRKKKADLKKLMSISDNIADLNVERFKKFLGSSEVEKMSTAVDLVADVARPAALAFDGPAYRGMDAATFSEEDWAFGARSVRLLSGLYGVLRPTDLIQPYRLEMGSRVAVAGMKDLYEYWKGDIAQCILEDIQGEGSVKSGTDEFLVVNVASQEYSKAVDFEQLESAGGRVVTCVFKDDGRVLSVFAKRARGLLARHVVVNRAKDVADLESFSAEGYRLDRSQCGDGLLVFTRSKAQRAAPTRPTTAAKTQAKPKGKAKAKAEAAPKAKVPSIAAHGKKRAAAGAGAGARKKKAATATGASTTSGKRGAPSAGGKRDLKAKSKKA
ncbi:unnamed protein product [Ectocarpus sp. 12 AP-2014]